MASSVRMLGRLAPLAAFSPLAASVALCDNRDKLKAQIVQNTAEMEERTRWEARRLNQLFKEIEHEMADTQTQRVEAEKIKQIAVNEVRLASLLRENEELRAAAVENARVVCGERLMASREAHEASVRAATEAELEAHVDTARSVAQAEIGLLAESWAAERAAKAPQRLAMIGALSAAVDESVGQITFKMSEDSRLLNVHRASLACLNCATQLQSEEPAASAAKALRAATDDEVLGLALAALPEDGLSRGFALMGQLQTRFERVRHAVAANLMVPDGFDGLLGQLLGEIALRSGFRTPFGASRGSVPPTEQLDAAATALRVGDLPSALAKLSDVRRGSDDPAADWLYDARGRLLADQTAKLLRAKVCLLNASAH